MKNLEKVFYKLPNYIFSSVILGIVAVVLGTVSYLDIFNLCYINIDGDITRGNEKTIKQAIRLIKEEDKESYKTLCHYVNTVKERYCLIPKVPIKFGTEPGCYIRGSKVIYLIPERGENQQIVRQRATTIQKYAQKSKIFWNNY